MVYAIHLFESDALTPLHAVLNRKNSISSLALRLLTGFITGLSEWLPGCAAGTSEPISPCEDGASDQSLSPAANFSWKSAPSSAATSVPSTTEDRLLRRVFNMLDADKDGHVSIDEVAQHLAKLGMTEPNKAAMPRGQGLLAFEDFVRLYEEGDEELAEAFNLYDKDGDGFISCEELGHALVGLGFTECQNEHFCHLIIKSVDVNLDGKIDFLEFCRMMTSHF